ncbi:MAG: hypothetical protein G01um10145_66 [Microgenomates group bacterium Gr01-1014_5]|nr:MAG: hypothetical protein G01um10145_66 [Microgenomates group bacterium Gr01-1014_5]
MAKTILTDTQKLLLDLISKKTDIVNNFYLSGGTALAEYYLQHRLSEDLDFFCMEEVDPMNIQVSLKSLQKEARIDKIDFQQSFNRNLFFLHHKEGVIKTEFTYYPFTQIEQPKVINGIKVDSLIDIATNKTFTIYQQPSSRHFIDLYLIIKTKGWEFKDLIKKAKAKFDSPIDPIQMGQQLLKVTALEDYPALLTELPEKEWQDFWLKEAQNLKELALTN